MPDNYSMVECQGNALPDIKTDCNNLAFEIDQTTDLIIVGDPQLILIYLKFRISRNHKNLLAHVQRIMLCFKHQMQKQLIAAMCDLFITLPDKRGQAIKNRMLIGAKSKLPKQVFQLFIQALHSEQPVELSSRYSLLTKGLIGTMNLVNSKVMDRLDYDPLQLARDYIQYSQLNEAKAVLVDAIASTPERNELHKELLELYRLTGDKAGFSKQNAKLQLTDLELQQIWQSTELFFNA